MDIWLPCKVSQLDTPFGPDAVPQELDSSACPRVVRLLHLQLVQAKEVLLNVVPISPRHKKHEEKAKENVWGCQIRSNEKNDSNINGA